MLRRGICTLALALLAPAVALAQTGDIEAQENPDSSEAEEVLSPEDEEARERFDSGSQAFEVGDFERAAAEFRAAYELSQRPELLFNVYSALERAGELGEAARALEAYLRDAELEVARRSSLEARLARIRARIADQRAEDAEARLATERQAAGETTVDEGRGDSGGGGGVHPAATGLLIGGAALLVSFGIFAALAAAENGSLEDECGTSCSDEQVSTLGTFNLIADISWIAATVAVATGIVLLVVLDADGEEDDGSTAHVAPYVTGDGVGVGMWGAF